MKRSILLVLISLFAVCAVQAEPAAERLMHATFKVFNAASTATGFLLRDTAPDAASTQVVLVTAKHAFERAKGDHVLLVCRVKDATNRWQRLDHKVMIREGNRDLWTGHPTQDIAVLRCTLPTNAVFEALPVEALAGEARARASGLSIGSPLFYCCFPHRIEANSAAFPLYRTGTVSGYPLFPAAHYPVVHFSGATFAGDSGAPVAVATPVAELPLAVIGLIVTRTQHKNHITSEDVTLTLKSDVSLGAFVHAAYILECLDRMRAKPAAQ